MYTNVPITLCKYGDYTITSSVFTYFLSPPLYSSPPSRTPSSPSIPSHPYPLPSLLPLSFSLSLSLWRCVHIAKCVGGVYSTYNQVVLKFYQNTRLREMNCLENKWFLQEAGWAGYTTCIAGNGKSPCPHNYRTEGNFMAAGKFGE